MDDTIRPGVTAESLAGLKSVFPNWGNASTTAGNASGVGDGAAICVLTTRANAEKEGMDIIGKYVTSTVVSVEPKYMGISPAVAIPKVLEMTGLSKEDIDVYEVCIYLGFAIFEWSLNIMIVDQRSLCFPVCLLCGRARYSYRKDQPQRWRHCYKPSSWNE